MLIGIIRIIQHTFKKFTLLPGMKERGKLAKRLWSLAILLPSFCIVLWYTVRILTDYGVDFWAVELNAWHIFHQRGPVPLSKNLQKSLRSSIHKCAQLSEFPGKIKTLRVDTPLVLVNRTSYIDIQPGKKRKYDPDKFAKYYREQYFEWLCINNAQTWHFGGVYFRGKGYYLVPHEQQPRGETNHEYTVYQVDHVFNFLHIWDFFGHYLIDYLPVLSMMTPEMRQQGYFVVRKRSSFVANALMLYGIPDSHIVELNNNEEIFAKNMYLVRPLQMQVMLGVALRRMRAFFIQKFGLDNKKPFRYVFYNRKHNRKMVNFADLQKGIEEKFAHSKLNFELFQDEKKPAPEQFRWAANSFYYNEMLWSLSCHGSGYMNNIFMQSNTVFVVIETDLSDQHLFRAIAILFDRHGFIMRDEKMKHFSSSNSVRVKTVLPLAEASIRKAIELSKDWKRIPSETHANVPLLDVGFTLKTG